MATVESFNVQKTNKPPKTRFLFRNSEYDAFLIGSTTSLKELSKTSKTIFFSRYGDNTSAKLTMFGSAKEDITPERVDRILQMEEEHIRGNILHLGMISTENAFIRGLLEDSGKEEQPRIEIYMENQSYFSSPKELAESVLNISGGLSLGGESAFSFLPALNFSNIKRDYKHDQFSAMLHGYRKRTFNEDGYEIENEGRPPEDLSTSFNVVLDAKRKDIYNKPNTELNMRYVAEAYRKRVKLPDEELAWLEKAVTCVMKPLSTKN